MKKTLFALIMIQAAVVAPAWCQEAPAYFPWAPLLAKMAMGLSLSLALTGSAIGLVIAFQALLAGGEENFYKNIAVALMPSTQGIYGMVIFFTNLNGFSTDPYTVAGKAAIASVILMISAWHQGIVCAAGIKSIQEGRNTLGNALVAGAMPETYAVFALVMTFILK